MTLLDNVETAIFTLMYSTRHCDHWLIPCQPRGLKSQWTRDIVMPFLNQYYYCHHIFKNRVSFFILTSADSWPIILMTFGPIALYRHYFAEVLVVVPNVTFMVPCLTELFRHADQPCTRPVLWFQWIGVHYDPGTKYTEYRSRLHYFLCRQY